MQTGSSVLQQCSVNLVAGSSSALVQAVCLPRCFVSQVASIREAAAGTLQKIANEFGPDWARDNLVPQVLSLVKNPHYLYRMTMLVAVSMLAPILSHDVLVGHMLPVILSASKDKVGGRCVRI